MKINNIEVIIHPCKCTANNGEQCYNCLNGAHDICEGKKKCGKKREKSLGLILVFKKGKKQKTCSICKKSFSSNDADELILKLSECKIVAMKKHRYRTMHSIDDSLKIAGWELSDIRTGKQKIGEP